jgi:hypothetical protein
VIGDMTFLFARERRERPTLLRNTVVIARKRPPNAFVNSSVFLLTRLRLSANKAATKNNFNDVHHAMILVDASTL